MDASAPPLRRALAIAVTMAVITMVGACSSGSGGELTYWSMWEEGEPQQKVMARSIERFTQETGIQVDVEWAGRDAVNTKLPSVLNTSRVPDVVDQANDKLKPVLGEEEQGRGLGGVYEAKIPGEKGTTVGEVIPDKYIDSLDVTTKDGEPYMLPYSMVGVGFFYDASRFPDIADDPPETWDDFTATLDDVTKSKDSPAALTVEGDQPPYKAFYTTYLLTRDLGPGGLRKLAEDKSGRAWRDPAVVDAAAKVEELVEDGRFLDGFNSSKYPEQQKNWAKGDAALLLMGSWAPVETRPYAAKGMEYASFPFPETHGDAPSEEVQIFGFASPTQARNTDEADEFMTYMAGRDRLGELATEAETMSIRDDVDPPESQVDMEERIEKAPAVHATNDDIATFPGYQDKVYFPAVDALFAGDVTAEEFAKRMEKDQAAYWEAEN